MYLILLIYADLTFFYWSFFWKLFNWNFCWKLHIYILFQIFSYYSLLQDTEYSSLCCKVSLCCLFILYRSSFVSANPKFLIYPSPICRFCTYTGDLVIKKSTCNAGDTGLIPGSGRSPGRGNGNLLQYSCLRNPMDRGAWRATVHGVAKSQTRLSD